MEHRILLDYQKHPVRLTTERLEHILMHPEMSSMLTEIEAALSEPDYVIRSRSDESALLHFRYYRATIVGDKWLSVVVKYQEQDAFVVTAFLTNKLHKGDIVWQRKPQQ
jgi:hypothetical protein